jgi:hypothetical protein
MRKCRPLQNATGAQFLYHLQTALPKYPSLLHLRKLSARIGNLVSRRSGQPIEIELWESVRRRRKDKPKQIAIKRDGLACDPGNRQRGIVGALSQEQRQTLLFARFLNKKGRLISQAPLINGSSARLV